jgi:regulatory protein
MTLPEPSLVISSLQRIPRKGEFLVTFSDGSYVRVLKDHLDAAGIEEGRRISRTRIIELESAYRLARARQAALRLLKVRPRTELELRRRLKAAGNAEDTVARVIADLKAEGLVDDRIFARIWIEEKVCKGETGRVRIRRDLETKGVAGEVVAEELDRRLSSRDESRAAEALAVKKIDRLRGASRREAVQKAYAYLVRRGFDSDVASEAARRAARSACGTDDDEI